MMKVVPSFDSESRYECGFDDKRECGCGRGRTLSSSIEIRTSTTTTTTTRTGSVEITVCAVGCLDGAELDMTVEDWIRYQMEVEYDKFKRDGERELMRFRKKQRRLGRLLRGCED